MEKTANIVTPRPYQVEAVSKLLNYIGDHPDRHPLIALPTGSGKSLVMAMVVKHIKEEWPEVDILILSHVREILEQNHRAIEDYAGIKVGLYSAGLGSRVVKGVTVAGIQSAHRKPELFENFKLIIIDECHLISPRQDSMYQKLLGGMDAIYFGVTATPFRLGDGYIYGRDMLFDDLIYDLTTLQPFNKLIEDGYLCNLRVKQTQLELDVDQLHTRGGDFIDSEMSLLFGKEQITESAISEIIRSGADYKKWLIFAIDIDHAEMIAESLIQKGIPTGLVHSKMEFDRADTLRKFKEQKYRAIVNVNVLTTGFDDPEIDLIALLRPTQSPVIHVQTIGRGLRISPGKDHCLILDFAGNTKRIGPINDVQVRKKQKTEGGEPITKTCPECDTICHPSVRICEVCGFKFEFKSLITAMSGNENVISTGFKWYDVDKVTYSLYQKANTPDMIKVTYRCNIKFFNEFWCLDHRGYARFRAVNLMLNRGDISKEDLVSTASAMSIVEGLKKPIQIQVSERKKWPEIIKYKFS